MKPFCFSLMIFALALNLKATQSHAFTSVTWNKVESFKYVWKDSIKNPEKRKAPEAAEFKLLLPKGWNDPGNFLRLSIQLDDYLDYTFDQLMGAKLSPPFLSYAIDKELYVAAVPFAGKDQSPMIAVQDYNFPSETAMVNLIRMSPYIRTPMPDIQKIAIYAKSIEDLDHDGTLELIGPNEFSDPSAFSKRVRAYCPYLVYKYSKESGMLVLDEALSKKYNIDKRDGWMGAAYSKDLVVVVPDGQSGSNNDVRGKVMTVNEAKKLVGKVYLSDQ